MSRLNRGLALAALITIFSTTLAPADDWPQWRGPNRDGISRETGLLKEWPEGGPRLLWHKKDLGDGYSTPSVVGGVLYLISNDGLDDEMVQALSAEDGKLIWSERIGRVGHPEQQPPYPASRSTPTVEGDVLYALGSDGDLVCMDIADGKVRWHKHLRSDFEGKYGEWAYSESPLIDGDALICTPGGPSATIVKLDKRTGDLIWKCAIGEGWEAGYASPIVIEAANRRQYVQFLSKALVGVEAVNGDLLWTYERIAEGSPANIPTPVADNGYVFDASARGGSGLVHVTMKDGVVTAEEVYHSQGLPNSIGGTVKLGDYLYGTNRQGMMCIEFLTGEIKWQDRAIGPSSVLYADGMIYIHGENNEMALIEATPEGYRERGRFTPPDKPQTQGKAWAYPVIADGRLYIRDATSLWAYDVRAEESK